MLGVLLTLILVIFTSVIGMSLVRNQGFKNFLLMQQKMAAGEPGGRDDQKRIADYCRSAADPAGLLHRLPRSAAAVAAGAKHLTMKLLPHLRFSRMPGGGFSTGPGDTFEGNTSVRMTNTTVWIIKTIGNVFAR